MWGVHTRAVWGVNWSSRKITACPGEVFRIAAVRWSAAQRAYLPTISCLIPNVCCVLFSRSIIKLGRAALSLLEDVSIAGLLSYGGWLAISCVRGCTACSMGADARVSSHGIIMITIE